MHIGLLKFANQIGKFSDVGIINYQLELSSFTLVTLIVQMVCSSTTTIEQDYQPGKPKQQITKQGLQDH